MTYERPISANIREGDKRKAGKIPVSNPVA